MLTSVSQPDSTKSPAQQVDYANQRAMEIAGLPPNDISPEAWANVLHPDDRERVTQEWIATITAKCVSSANTASSVLTAKWCMSR